MHKRDLHESPPPLRRAILGALIGGLCAAAGAFVARPLVAAFRDSAPWVLPAIAAAVVAAVVLMALIWPISRRNR